MGSKGLEQLGPPRAILEGDPQRITRPYSRVLHRGGEGTSQKYGGTDHEKSRCTYLDGDQGVPCATRTRIPGHFAAHRRHKVEAGRVQRRCEPEERSGHEGASHQEYQHPPVCDDNGKVE